METRETPEELACFKYFTTYPQNTSLLLAAQCNRIGVGRTEGTCKFCKTVLTINKDLGIIP